MANNEMWNSKVEKVMEAKVEAGEKAADMDTEASAKISKGCWDSENSNSGGESVSSVVTVAPGEQRNWKLYPELSSSTGCERNFTDELLKQREECNWDLNSGEITADGCDSGFISGSLGSSDYTSKSHTDRDTTVSLSGCVKEIGKQSDVPASNCCERKTVLDSGCIESELQSEEVRVEEQKGNGEASAVSTSNVTMIKDQNIDSSMAERFRHLALKKMPIMHSNGSLMNNLSALGDDRNSTPNTKDNSHPQGFPKTDNSANIATGVNLSNITSWRKFYQQDDNGDTPLHLACIYTNVDVVTALIRMAVHPCLLNIKNDDIQTPLHLAAHTAQPRIIRILLIAGAEPNIRDGQGNTALHLACITGSEQCVRALTIPITASEINEAHRHYGHWNRDNTVSYVNCARLPSNLEISNFDGENCVHLAAKLGNINILRLLVVHGANINAREGKSGFTPLHLAIRARNKDLVDFLLNECLKLNLEAVTYSGLTAYQVARINMETQIQNMLEEQGAEPLSPSDTDTDTEYEYEYESSDNECSFDHGNVGVRV